MQKKDFTVSKHISASLAVISGANSSRVAANPFQSQLELTVCLVVMERHCQRIIITSAISSSGKPLAEVITEATMRLCDKKYSCIC